MNRRLKIVTRILGIAIVIVAGIIALILFRRSLIIPDNTPGTIGNTAGNLYNTGLFCESDGKVFFSNAYDNGNLYVMNSDQTDIKKLVAGDATHINVGGDYLYFYVKSTSAQDGLGYIRNGRGIYRCDKPGKNIAMIQDTIANSILLLGNDIYYTKHEADSQNSGTAKVSLHKIDINGNTEELVLNERLTLGSAYGNKIYYAGESTDHYLYSYTPDLNIKLLEDKSTYMYLPIVTDGYIYYLDLKDDYHLKCYSTFNGTTATIVDERIDTYNIFGSVIYYQNVDPNNYALKRVNIDGSDLQVVCDGVYSDINITSSYVYFHDFNSTMPIYMTPTYGSINVTTFDAAKEAAFHQ